MIVNIKQYPKYTNSEELKNLYYQTKREKLKLGDLNLNLKEILINRSE